jgi:hypothetical protein
METQSARGDAPAGTLRKGLTHECNVIIRCEGERMVGYTILHASRRSRSAVIVRGACNVEPSVCHAAPAAGETRLSAGWSKRLSRNLGRAIWFVGATQASIFNLLATFSMVSSA